MVCNQVPDINSLGSTRRPGISLVIDRLQKTDLARQGQPYTIIALLELLHGRALQERALFVKNVVPQSGSAWLSSGHAQAIPGR